MQHRIYLRNSFLKDIIHDKSRNSKKNLVNAYKVDLSYDSRENNIDLSFSFLSWISVVLDHFVSITEYQ